MSLDIYINDRLIDLSNTSGIGLTFQIGSILNPSTRSGNLSNKFKAPKTRNNSEIFANLLNINSNTNIPYERQNARVIQNGVEIISNGFAIVDSINKEYSVTIYSGNVSFFDLIKDKTVGDLDWSDSDHVYDLNNILASFTGTDKYIYPIIEWGANGQLLNNGTLQDVDALLPCAYIKDVLEKIAISVGYELKGSFKNFQQYQRLILTPNQYGFTQEVVDDTNGYADDVTPTGPVDTTVDDLSVIPAPPVEHIEVPLVYNTFSKPTFSGFSYTPSETIYGTLNFYIRINWSGGFGGLAPANTPVRVVIEEDGNEIFGYTSGTFLNFGVNINQVFSTGRIVLKSTSTYTVRCFMDAVRQPTTTYNVRYQLIDSNFAVDMARDFPYGGTIKFSRLFTIKQTDIFKDIMNQYSLSMQTNEVTKEVFLNPLDDLQKNISIAKNWSEKINLATNVKVKYSIPGYAQVNYLQYKVDSDVTNVPLNYGRGSIEVNNINLPPEKIIIQLKTIGTIHYFRLANEWTPLVEYQALVGSFFDQKDSRILLLDKINKTIDWKTSVNNDTGQTNNLPLCYFIKPGKNDNLDFESLIAEHYVTLKGILDKTKFLGVGLRLNEVDISELDFSIPVYLDIHTSEISLNGYFYINKISNFKQNATTKVDLIRL